MENRSKRAKKADSNLKAMGKGERTSKKVSTIRTADGSSFRRKNANQYGAAEGGNDYTEKRVNRTDSFETGGTADSAENGGANVGGTLGSSMMKRGGSTTKNKFYLFNAKNGVITIKSKFQNVDDLGEYIIKNVDKSIVDNTIYGNIRFYEIKGTKNNIIGWISAQDNESETDVLKRLKAKYSFQKDKKMANGGGLANVPESFPETDAMSYKKGGGVEDVSKSLYVEKIYDNNGNIMGYTVKDKFNVSGKYTLSSKKERAEENRQYLIDNPSKLAYYRKNEYKNGGSTKGFEYSIGGL
jgi:hypothetical protein